MKYKSENLPFVLVILDGFGYRSSTFGNAPLQASMPTFNYIKTIYPSTLLHASGTHVGLLNGNPGNSEVGHFTIGAGAIIPSLLSQFHTLIHNKQLLTLPHLSEIPSRLARTRGHLHIMGLISDGGVHSHSFHLYGLLEAMKSINAPSPFLHLFTDGRDTKPHSAPHYIDELEAVCHQLNYGTIASLHGRFYAMDRDSNWDRTTCSYQTLTLPQPTFEAGWQTYIDQQYSQRCSDEFLPPVQLVHNSHIRAGDGVIFFNIRPDRARQLTRAFVDPHIQDIRQEIEPATLSFFITFTNYFTPEYYPLNQSLLPQVAAQENLLQTIHDQTQGTLNIITMAETEKFAHVTTFLHGKHSTAVPGEKQYLIPSIKTRTYADHPEMSAHKITQQLLSSLRDHEGDFFVVNYANADMVGHSGNLAATIKACECLDEQLTILFHEIVERRHGTLCITADHGNAEQMMYDDGSINTAHTSNKVPFIIAHPSINRTLFHMHDNCGLADIAPTILSLLHLDIPTSMHHNSILYRSLSASSP